jgi:Holliday junction resolvasome RuvABC endonuclease subunit
MALDLAPKVTGWAIGHLSDEAPEFGRWMLPRLGTEGAKYAKFADLLYGALKSWQPTAVVVEAPLPPAAQAAQKDTSTAFRQYGFRAIVHEAAWRRSIPITEVSADMVRIELLGRCRWPKGGAKTAVIRHCIALGLQVSDDNEADAILIWHWHRRRMRGFSGRPAPLLWPENTVAMH